MFEATPRSVARKSANWCSFLPSTSCHGDLESVRVGVTAAVAVAQAGDSAGGQRRGAHQSAQCGARDGIDFGCGQLSGAPAPEYAIVFICHSCSSFRACPGPGWKFLRHGPGCLYQLKDNAVIHQIVDRVTDVCLLECAVGRISAYPINFFGG
jgi:hypothetical protein